jgi:hypothetical protein
MSASPSCPLTFFISPSIGMFGKFFAKTFWQKESNSTNFVVSNIPVECNPKLNPPMPLNRSRTFNFLIHYSIG